MSVFYLYQSSQKSGLGAQSYNLNMEEQMGNGTLSMGLVSKAQKLNIIFIFQYKMSLSDISNVNNLIGSEIGPYLVIEVLGQGAYGKVFKGIHSQTKQIIALKVMQKAKIEAEKSERVKQIRKRLMKSQGQIMMKCRSQHVVKCYERFENKYMMIFALEYCNGGDLDKHMKRKKIIPEKEAIRILKQIICGFAELHQHNVIHRDLKPENIFKHNEKFKIGDMGFAKIISNLIEVEGTTLGTMTTMAPEIMKQGAYGIKADLWSLGIIYYQMIYGQLPIKYKNRQQMLRDFKKQISFPESDNCSKQSIQFLKSLLVTDPKFRMDWSQVYKHPLLKRADGVMPFEYHENIDLTQSEQVHNKLQLRHIKIDVEQELNEAENIKDAELPNAVFRNSRQKTIEQQRIVIEAEHIKVQIEKYIDEINFQLQKSQLILKNVIQVFYENKIPYKKNKFTLEFLYLVICRCFFMVSPINDALAKKKNKFDWKYYNQFLHCTISASFLKEFKSHYQKVKQYKLKIEQELYNQENKLKNRFGDVIDKMFDSKHYEQKNKITTGIQNKDYETKEQIDFTLNNYVPDLFNKLQQNDLSHQQQVSLKTMEHFMKNQYKYVNAATYTNQKAYLKLVIQKYG